MGILGLALNGPWRRLLGAGLAVLVFGGGLYLIHQKIAQNAILRYQRDSAVEVVRHAQKAANIAERAEVVRAGELAAARAGVRSALVPVRRREVQLEERRYAKSEGPVVCGADDAELNRLLVAAIREGNARVRAAGAP